MSELGSARDKGDREREVEWAEKRGKIRVWRAQQRSEALGWRKQTCEERLADHGTTKGLYMAGFAVCLGTIYLDKRGVRGV